jgi:ABC-type iron transport system FetAB ATPase subunit
VQVREWVVVEGGGRWMVRRANGALDAVLVAWMAAANVRAAPTAIASAVGFGGTAVALGIVLITAGSAATTHATTTAATTTTATTTISLTLLLLSLLLYACALPDYLARSFQAAGYVRRLAEYWALVDGAADVRFVQRPGLLAQRTVRPAAGEQRVLVEVVPEGAGQEGAGRLQPAVRLRAGGEWVRVEGPSGAGKSALVRAMALRARGVRWAPGVEPVCLPQRPFVFEGSLRANLAFPREEGDVGVDEARRALSAVGLERLAAQVGAEREVEWERVLSGGERQGVCFARAMLRVAEVRRSGVEGVLVADEPTSSMDGQSASACWDAVQAAGVSVVVVAHEE